MEDWKAKAKELTRMAYLLDKAADDERASEKTRAEAARLAPFARGLAAYAEKRAEAEGAGASDVGD